MVKNKIIGSVTLAASILTLAACTGPKQQTVKQLDTKTSTKTTSAPESASSKNKKGTLEGDFEIDTKDSSKEEKQESKKQESLKQETAEQNAKAAVELVLTYLSNNQTNPKVTDAAANEDFWKNQQTNGLFASTDVMYYLINQLNRTTKEGGMTVGDVGFEAQKYVTAKPGDTYELQAVTTSSFIESDNGLQILSIKVTYKAGDLIEQNKELSITFRPDGQIVGV